MLTFAKSDKIWSVARILPQFYDLHRNPLGKLSPLIAISPRCGPGYIVANKSISSIGAGWWHRAMTGTLVEPMRWCCNINPYKSALKDWCAVVYLLRQMAKITIKVFGRSKAKPSISHSLSALLSSKEPGISLLILLRSNRSEDENSNITNRSKESSLVVDTKLYLVSTNWNSCSLPLA